MNKQSETVEQVAGRIIDDCWVSNDWGNCAIDYALFATKLLSDPAVLELVPGVKELREENERLKAEACKRSMLATPRQFTEEQNQHLRSRIASLEQENERLKRILAPINESIERSEAMGRKQNEWIDYAKALEANAGVAAAAEFQRLRSRIASLEQQLAAKQAEIDALMLEYCPDEMTPQQVEEWGKHQQLAEGGEAV